jgi:hypothetical protein
MILSRVLTMGVLGIAVLTAAFGAGAGAALGLGGGGSVALAYFGALAGWLLASVAMGTLDSAVATVRAACLCLRRLRCLPLPPAS